MMFEPIGEVGANFSLQLSSQRQFTKVNNKKVIAENQCEKHKKSSLVYQKTMFDRYFCIKSFCHLKTLEKRFEKFIFVIL